MPSPLSQISQGSGQNGKRQLSVRHGMDENKEKVTPIETEDPCEQLYLRLVNDFFSCFQLCSCVSVTCQISVVLFYNKNQYI